MESYMEGRAAWPCRERMSYLRGRREMWWELRLGLRSAGRMCGGLRCS